MTSPKSVHRTPDKLKRTLRRQYKAKDDKKRADGRKHHDPQYPNESHDEYLHRRYGIPFVDITDEDEEAV